MRCNMLTLSDKWPVIRSQLAAWASQSRQLCQRSRWGHWWPDNTDTDHKQNSSRRRNKDQPFANQTQWVRSSPSGEKSEKWAPHNAPDRKLKYYTLCSALGLSHHNYLRTRNFCHSLPIRISSKTTFVGQNSETSFWVWVLVLSFSAMYWRCSQSVSYIYCRFSK